MMQCHHEDVFLRCAWLSNSSLLMFKQQARTVHVSFVPGTARHQYCWSAHICYCAESADCFASDDTMNIICLYSFCKKTAQGQRAGGAESGHAESLTGKVPSLHQTVCLRADTPTLAAEKLRAAVWSCMWCAICEASRAEQRKQKPRLASMQHPRCLSRS